MDTKNRPIPGTIQSQDREFLYVEVRSGESFGDLIDRVFDSTPNIPSPISGGVIEEKVRITTKDRLTLLGISYRGDKEGWRKKIQGFCTQEGRKYGVPQVDRLSLSEGQEIPIADCLVEFER
jgi:hypothetical protein